MKNIDFGIAVDVSKLSIKNKNIAIDAFYKLGIKRDIYTHGAISDDMLKHVIMITNALENGKITNNPIFVFTTPSFIPTHTFKQLLELSNNIKDKKLSDLNSDDLINEMTKNKDKIQQYQLRNKDIVEILNSRGLKPIGSLDDSKLNENLKSITADELKSNQWWMACYA